MTRINLIDPKKLMDQHLIAEYREIRMLCGSLPRTLNSKDGFMESRVPKKFSLVNRHMYFFYNKGKFLHRRYNLLCAEMRQRGFNPRFAFPREKWPNELYNDWEPSEEDIQLVRDRIEFRISQKPHWYRYYGRKLCDVLSRDVGGFKMSWWVCLRDECGTPMPVEKFTDGGTYAVGGTDVAELNVTYNYSDYFKEGLGYSFWDLNGKRPIDVIEDLTRAVSILGTTRFEDYWARTAGNAGYALAILKRWAEQAITTEKDYTFEVD